MVDPTGKTRTNGDPLTGEQELLSGQIGHYQIVAELGRGGMGAVYRAHEPSLNRYVAIKVLARHLADDASLVARFAREAKSVAALNHPNIVHIYFTGEEQGLPYFVMECVEGDTLADLIREKGTLPPKEAAGILLQAAAGLAAAHDRGIVHRDIKPSNLMIDGGGTLKITDFGIALARDIGDKLTTTGQFVGTTGYVSPEVCKGQPVDSRSDIFSLGVVLYEMLAGATPFNDDSPLGLMMQVVEQPVPDVRGLNPGVDEKLVQILDRMIEKNPDNRYQTCHELTADLKRYIAGAPLAEVKRASGADAATVVTGADALPRQPRAVEHKRSRWPLALVLLLFVAAGAGGVWWAMPLWQEGATTAATGDTVAFGPASDAPAVSGEVALGEPATDVPAADDAISYAADFGDPPPGGETPVIDGGTPEGIAVTDTTEAPRATSAPADSAPAPAAAAPTQVAALTPSPSATEVRSSRVVVIAHGDQAITGPVEQMLSQRLSGRGYQVMDAALLPGAGRYVSDRGLDLSGLSESALSRGVGLLVVASVVPVGATDLDYYGQRELLYSSRIELKAYDLASGESLGGGWNGDVQYTALNATAKGREAATPLISQLLRAVGDP